MNQNEKKNERDYRTCQQTARKASARAATWQMQSQTHGFQAAATAVRYNPLHSPYISPI